MKPNPKPIDIRFHASNRVQVLLPRGTQQADAVRALRRVTALIAKDGLKALDRGKGDQP